MNQPLEQPTLEKIVEQAKACRLCEDILEPNPIFVISPRAKLLIVGQAPGRKVHETNIPWNDPSGDRLRRWLNVDRDQFYTQPEIAILPAGFCYPGKGKSGDLPPPKICAQTWHDKMLRLMPDVELTLLIGMYAQNHYLGNSKKATLTETVQHWEEYLDKGFLPLPHPSPRNAIWLKRNAWFENEVVPQLQLRVSGMVGAS
jgi:uracil-DNA glycosylase